METPGFVAATNRNDVVPEYLLCGEFKPRPSLQTLSNAMDVGNPSTFDRLLAIFGGDWRAMSRTLAEEVVNDEDTLKTIGRIYAEKNYLMDPHTAVGYLGAERYLQKHPESEPLVVLSTAHPGKFVEVVKEAAGQEPALPPALASLAAKPKVAVVMENKAEALREFLLKNFAG
jgi:threonine synthase